jgi:hypothetical protein
MLYRFYLLCQYRRPRGSLARPLPINVSALSEARWNTAQMLVVDKDLVRGVEKNGRGECI